MVNLRSNIAKMRYWREYVQLMITNEAYMRKRIQKVLKRQYESVADSLTNIDAVINAFNTEIRGIFEESVIRIASIYRPYAMQKIEDSRKADYESTFWQEIREFAKTHAAERVVDIQSTTRKKLKLILERALETGQGYVGTRTAIRGLAEITTAFRAFMIARTEIHSFTGVVVDQTMLNDGGMKEKEWMGAADERERPTHVEANGQIVAVDKKFSVGRDKLRFPGDPKGSAKEIIACRCAALYN